MPTNSWMTKQYLVAPHAIEHSAKLSTADLQGTTTLEMILTHLRI